jgi:hypothetical protein
MNKEKFITERTRIISEMLDNPDGYGIYPTTKCFNALDKLFDKIKKQSVAKTEIMDGTGNLMDMPDLCCGKYEPHLYNYKTGNDLSSEEVEKAEWHIPTKIDMEQIEETQHKITEEFVKMRDSDLNHQFDYRDRDYFQRGYNLGIISQKDYVTDNEIEKAAEEHALFLGYGGKYNINTAKQVSFIQGAKSMRDGLIKK